MVDSLFLLFLRREKRLWGAGELLAAGDASAAGIFI